MSFVVRSYSRWPAFRRAASTATCYRSDRSRWALIDPRPSRRSPKTRSSHTGCSSSSSHPPSEPGPAHSNSGGAPPSTARSNLSLCPVHRRGALLGLHVEPPPSTSRHRPCPRPRGRRPRGRLRLDRQPADEPDAAASGHGSEHRACPRTRARTRKPPGCASNPAGQMVVAPAGESPRDAVSSSATQGPDLRRNQADQRAGVHHAQQDRRSVRRVPHRQNWRCRQTPPCQN